MDKTIRRYTDFGEMKADEYRYWQGRPIHERVAAVSELTQEQYALKGAAPHVPRLQRTLVREIAVSKKSTKTDLARLDRMKDKDIDYSDIPPLDASFFTKATVEWPRRKSK
jgi:hypothetical protein